MTRKKGAIKGEKEVREKKGPTVEVGPVREHTMPRCLRLAGSAVSVSECSPAIAEQGDRSFGDLEQSRDLSGQSSPRALTAS
jgi:hypothetical protein